MRFDGFGQSSLRPLREETAVSLHEAGRSFQSDIIRCTHTHYPNKLVLYRSSRYTIWCAANFCALSFWKSFDSQDLFASKAADEGALLWMANFARTRWTRRANPSDLIISYDIRLHIGIFNLKTSKLKLDSLCNKPCLTPTNCEPPRRSFETSLWDFALRLCFKTLVTFEFGTLKTSNTSKRRNGTLLTAND